MLSFLRLDFRLSKKPLRRRESTSTRVKFDCWSAVSNVEYKGSMELNLAKILNRLLIWNKTKKQNKQMFKICTIFLSKNFLGIWKGDLGYTPPPPLPTPTPTKGPAPYPTEVWYFQLQGIMSFLFYEILTPMDICWSHSIATGSHSSLVENIESAGQDWTVLIQN